MTNCLFLNMSLEKNVTVLPETRQDLQKIANQTVFSSVDFSNFFFQIPADENYGRDVCLITDLGNYSPNVCLQGDSNSPNSSTIVSNTLLNEVSNGLTLIDDIIWANQNVFKHLEDFEQILANIAYVSEPTRLCKLKTDKINLLSDRIQYCGHLLENGKVKLTSKSLDKFLKNKPTTNGQLHSFLCVGNYFSPSLNIGTEIFKEMREEIAGKPKGSSI